MSSPPPDNQLTGGQQTMKDIQSEVAKLEAGYNAAIQKSINAKKQLNRELGEQQRLKWELEHQTKRSKDYEKQIHRIRDEVSELKSTIPLLSESFSVFIYQFVKSLIICNLQNTPCCHFQAWVAHTVTRDGRSCTQSVTTLLSL